MTSKNKPTPPKKPTAENNDDPQSYVGVAIAFFTIGLALTVSEGTRAAGLPFLVLGITFFIISQQKPAKKQSTKKRKK